MTRILTLLTAICLAAPAWATPPRMTVSDDRMIAATQTHFYVLRDIVDNLGSHYAGLHDQHLVEISLETGEATRFWPLRRMHTNTLPMNDYLNPGLVEDRPGETVDLMHVLRDVAAQPIAPQDWQQDDVALADGTLTFKGDTALSPFGLRAAGRAQLAILRAAYPPIKTEEAYRRGDRIDFYDLYAEGDWFCDLLADRRAIYRANDKLILAKLRCEDADGNGQWTFHAILKDDL